MSAEWFKNKKEQLRLLGKHPVPGTKAKDMARVNKEACVASPSRGNIMSMNRGSKMLMLSMADRVADKFRKKKIENLENLLEKPKNVVEKDSVPVVSDKDEVESDSTISIEEDILKPVESKSKSWDDVVKEAGGLLVMAKYPIASDEDEDANNNVAKFCEGHQTSHSSDDPDAKSGNDQVHKDIAKSDDDQDHEDIAKEVSSKKKKTPLQYRTMQPKRMAEESISSSNKKMFKEAWNTDKSRMEKRQVKYNKPQNFLLILEDNIHQSGHDHGAKTAGKLMVYGKGSIREKFLKSGIKYNSRDYVMHANAHNFEVDNVKGADENSAQDERVEKVGGGETTALEKDLNNRKKSQKERTPLYNMKSVAKKVEGPGCIYYEDSDNDDSEGKESTDNE